MAQDVDTHLETLVNRPLGASEEGEGALALVHDYGFRSTVAERNQLATECDRMERCCDTTDGSEARRAFPARNSENLNTLRSATRTSALSRVAA